MWEPAGGNIIISALIRTGVDIFLTPVARTHRHHHGQSDGISGDAL